MNRILILAATSLAVMAGTARADDRADRWGMGGVGAGATAGALIAGPPGLVLGSAIGGFFGERMGRARTATDLETELTIAISDLDLLRASLDGAQRQLEVVRADLADRDQRIAELQRSKQITMGLESDVLFRTGSSGLEPMADSRLDSLATVMLENAELIIRLDGYADPRGTEDFNMDLSRNRTETVRDALVARGVPPQRIEAHAHGDNEAISSDGDLDAYALERRVRVRLEGDDPEAKVARRP
jgi:outer membrane protein OmpA-like peptidoglycan-associated protein